MKIRSTQVYLNEELIPAVVHIDDKKIVGILDYDSDYDYDYKDAFILPGFIDIHTHGYKGCNASRPNYEGLDIWTENLLHEGVTSVLFTTGTQSYDKNIIALKLLSDYILSENTKGAHVLGINVEGNFIDKQYRGAQELSSIVRPSKDIFNDYLKASNNTLKSVICAVEHDDKYEFVHHASQSGVAVSVGHSNATHKEVSDAVSYGLKGATHTGNGMRPFHHREPGVFGAAMNLDELYAEVIVDGHHLHFETVNIIGRLKGKDKLILITDSSSYKDFDGIEDGYVRSLDENNTIRDERGNLSGSNLKFNEGLYNAYYKSHLDLVTVINASSANPAHYLNVADHKGYIRVGYDADLVICDDQFNVLETYVSAKRTII